MKIEHAAIKIGERLVTGSVLHACLWVEAFATGLMPRKHEADMTKEDWRMVYLEVGVEEGFVLEDGTFIDREEAAKIALDNGQTTPDYISKKNELHVPDIF